LFQKGLLADIVIGYKPDTSVQRVPSANDHES
jgi:hypothetical protein